MPIIGGFHIITYEATRSWGIEPASASGTGVVEGGGAPTFEAGDYVVYSFMGVSFHGICSSMERLRSRENGDEWAFSLVDNRIRLRWAQVFGQWNMEENDLRPNGDQVNAPTSALDSWTGGRVGFDNNVDFTIPVGEGSSMPSPAVRDADKKRRRMFRHIRPAQWAAQCSTYTQEPYSASFVLQDAMRGAEGGGSMSFNFHSVQVKPVYEIDANSGMSLAALIQQIADEQGLMVGLSGFNTLRFEKINSGALVIPPTAHVRRFGTAISSEPTKVRLVGGRVLVQVNEVNLVPDWKPGWEDYMAEPAWLEKCGELMQDEGPQETGTPQYYAERAAFARSISVREFIIRANEDEDDFADYGTWGSVSRMDMPAWLYINNLVFRSYKLPEVDGNEGKLYGLPIRSLELNEHLLCAVKVDSGDENGRIKYDTDNLVFYPDAAAYVICRGQQLDLLNASAQDAMIRNEFANANSTWTEVADFVIDEKNRSIRFAAPLFKEIEENPLLIRPNRGEGESGWADLSEEFPEGSPYLDIVVPNPLYEIEKADVRAALSFKLGVHYKDFGSGPRWTSYHAPAIAPHLLHGGGSTPSGCQSFDGNPGVPDPPPEGFLEILYENGKTAEQASADAVDGLIVRGGVEQSGEYVIHGFAGTVLGPALSRVTTVLTREDGLVETVEFAKGRPSRGFVSSREIAGRIRNEELYDGQREISREITELRAMSRLYRHKNAADKGNDPRRPSMPDAFGVPAGGLVTDVRRVDDPNGQFPEGRAEEIKWRAGDLVWLDENHFASRSGTVFGGVVVMDSTSGSVQVAVSGAVPVAVEPGTDPGPVMANPGDWKASGSGSWPIGMLAHADAVPGSGDATLAVVRLGGGGGSGPVDCPFGEIITWTDGEGEAAETETGIRGGIIHCGDQNWNFDADPIDLSESGTWLVSIAVTCEVNRDDDNEILLPGIKTGTKPTGAWTRTAWSSGTNYPANTAPVLATGSATVVLPIGKLTVSIPEGSPPGTEGTATLENAGCGHFTITHCAGTIGYERG